MQALNPIRPLAALRGGDGIGAWMVPLLQVSPLTCHHADARFGGLPVPI